MKIAFVNQPFDRILPPHQGSIGICTLGAAKALTKYCDVSVYGLRDKHADLIDCRRDNVSFFFVPSAAQDRLFYKLRTTWSKVMNVHAPVSTSGWLYPDYGRRVASEMKMQHFDVVHLQQCSQYAPAIRRLNPETKIVLHLHAPWFSQSDPEMFKTRLRDIDFVTTVSDFVSSRMQQAFPMIKGRCETIHNGIDIELFRAKKDYSEARSRKEKRILFVGAVSPHSGVHVLLEAFRIVESKIPSVRLDVVGNQANYPIEEVFDLDDKQSIKGVKRYYSKHFLLRVEAKLSLAPNDAGTYMGQLRAQLPPLVAGKVTFAGPIGDRSQLVKCYYDADVFAFPPVCDHGFGLPALEAMAAGIPVVGSRSGGLVETVVDRQTGLLVPKNDAESLAQALLALLRNDDLRETMGTEARRRALHSFTWDVVVERMYRRYRSLCLEQTRSAP